MSVDHAAVMNSCNEKAWCQGIAALSDAERTVHLANVANCEIDNGTLWQFYYNSSGDNAVEAVTALRAIGADRAAAALQAANALFPDGSPAMDRDTRCDGLQPLMESPDNPLSALTSEFYRQKPDVFSKLVAFIDDHADELRDHEPVGA
jgi:Domain of unknown function (DUF4375)